MLTEAQAGLEIVSNLLPLGLLAVGMAFSVKQKLWVKRRDGNKCLMEGEDAIQCGHTKLEIDHITPQRFLYNKLGLLEEQVDSPLNAASLCQNHHRGHPQSKHPDAHVALWKYGEDKDSFKKLFEKRNGEVDDGEMYWNDSFGDILATKARQNTIDYIKAHPEDKFPAKKNGNSKH